MNPSIIHSAAISLCQENKKLTREIHYLTADPTGNITLLILDPVPAGEQAAVASELMKKEPSAEQAGFLTVPESGQYDIILRMAGGEFCGNASMSAAAYYSMLKGTSCGRITVKVSGAREPVIAAVSSCSSDPEVLPHTVSDPNTNVWHGAVEMPPARSIQTVCFPGDDSCQRRSGKEIRRRNRCCAECGHDLLLLRRQDNRKRSRPLKAVQRTNASDLPFS